MDQGFGVLGVQEYTFCTPNWFIIAHWPLFFNKNSLRGFNS